MKTVFQLLGLVWALNCNLHAQTVTIGGQTWNLSVLPLVAPEDVPARGSFHRLTHLNYPALPFDSAPGSAVYWLGTNAGGYGIYLIDDSEFEESSLGGMAAASRMATMLDATQDSGGADWPTVNYSSTDLWLEITNGSGPANFQITIHTPETNGVYDLFMATNLVTKNWVWLLRTEPGQTNVPLTNMPQTQAFFILGGMQDSDGDGLTDAYEVLVRKTDPQTWENRVQSENAITGTANWMLSNPITFGTTFATNLPGPNRTNYDRSWPTNDSDTIPEIEGFASATSVNVTEAIDFYVDVRDGTANYTLEVFRMGWYGGQGGRQMVWREDGQLVNHATLLSHKQPLPGINPTNGLMDCLLPSPANPNGPWTKSFKLTVPPDWVSGVYLVKLTTGTDVSPQTTGRQSYIIFSVREDSRPSDLLFQSSVTTYEAYNPWGAMSLYGNVPPNTPEGKSTSFNRPYGIYFSYDGVFEAAPSAGSGTFIAMQDGASAWEYNAVRWLERQGYDMTYTDDVQTHRLCPTNKPIKAFLSVGHDEYWSEEMRAHVETARDSGVNLGFLGANACFWKIHFDSTERSFSVNRDNWTDLWRGSPTNTSIAAPAEIALIGTEYVVPVSGNIKIASPLATNPGTSQPHWVYDHTGLLGGELFPSLLGYEVDGVWDDSSCNSFLTPLPSASTVILAASPFNDPGCWYPGHALMTLYTNSSGAQVFATGSMQWNWGLDDFWFIPWPRVVPQAQQMTHNILRAFSGRGTTPAAFDTADTLSGGNLNPPYYGSEGYWIADTAMHTGTVSVAFVTFTNAATQVWTDYGSDPRALDLGGSQRVSAAWTTSNAQNSSFTIGISFTDTNAHVVAVYCVDWAETGSVQEKIEIFDAGDSLFTQPLDTRDFLLPTNGIYWIWQLSGNKVIRVSKPDAMPENRAMVSGVFIGI